MMRSNKKARLDLTTVFVILSATVIPVTIACAQPANDDMANATDVTGIPFSDGPVDTSEATASDNDPSDCFNNGSVWYTFTPTNDVSIEVNTRGSDYDTTLAVYEGSQDLLSLIECNDDFYDYQSAVRFDATAGTTYYFMVGVCCGYGGTGGGMLVFNVEEIPPPMEVTLVVNTQGSFDQTGAVTINGTIACNNAASYSSVYGTVRQRAGRRYITGNFGVNPDSCSPTGSSWSATFLGDGVFTGGQVSAEVYADACDDYRCSNDSVIRTIRLKGGKKQ